MGALRNVSTGVSAGRGLAGVLGLVLATGLAGCGDGQMFGSRDGGGLLGTWAGGGDGGAAQARAAARNPNDTSQMRALGEGTGPGRETILDVFLAPDQNVNIRVNRFLWQAALETLDFLPLEMADPFSGVLIFGRGRAPGGTQTYRATVLVQDPALDARSLKVSVHSRGGPASAETTRRIEEAILTRARQLRIRQNAL